MKRTARKKIICIGGGYASCSAARLLSDLGHHVIILEQSDRLGGMARSFYLNGLTYEFGPHILANHGCTQEVINFLLKFIDVENTTMETASYLEGKYLSYPPNEKDISRLHDAKIIQKEIQALPSSVNEKNFETYLISKVGRTLYALFYKQFTEKFWGIDPKILRADWAKLRHLGENLSDTRMFFNNTWCTYPVHDYNELFDRISKGINVYYHTKIQHINFKKNELTDETGRRWSADYIINTTSLDHIFDNMYGPLKYAGYEISPVILDREYFHPVRPGTRKHYSMVYYPEKAFPYTRITEYKNFNHKNHDSAWKNRTIVTIETPSEKAKFYPFMDGVNEKRFKKYIYLLARYPHFVSLGRLGLYKYTTLDTTTAQVMRFIQHFHSWEDLSVGERINAYGVIRGSWNN